MDSIEDTFSAAELSDEVHEAEGGNSMEREYYHQVDVRSLPNQYTHADFKNLINKRLKLHGKHFKFHNKTHQSGPLVSVYFENEVDMENAVLVIHQYVWRNKVLAAQKSPNPKKITLGGQAKRKSDVLDDHVGDGDGGSSNDDDEEKGPSSKKKKQLMNPKLSVDDNLRNSFIPLWKMEYKDQLEMKQARAKIMLQELAETISTHNPPLAQWVQQQMSIHDGMPCELLDIRYPSTLTGYRNNCNFNLGLDPDTKQPAVGCKMHRYIENFKAIAQPDGLMHIPDKIKGALKAFQDMLRTKLNRQDIRYAKDLIVRSTKDTLLIIINQNPYKLPRHDRERFENVCKEYFCNGPGKSSGVTSVFSQIDKKRLKSFHLFGERVLYEYPLDLKIKLYPNGPYATHSEAAEIFYKTAIELIGPVENSTVIDLCCGVGPLGLSFAKHCVEVLGLDTVSMCTNYAKQNAEMNKITNAHYFTGRADDLTGNLCKMAKGDNIVVLCDPPRAGLNEKAIIHLRNNAKVKKILYMSINPIAGSKVYKNFTMQPGGKMCGEPFLPTKAVAIDMTPHTKVIHFVTIWERCSSVKNRKAEK